MPIWLTPGAAWTGSTPPTCHKSFATGALVVDTRPVEQRRRDRALPGAVIIDRQRSGVAARPHVPAPHSRGHRRQPTHHRRPNDGRSLSLAAAMLRQLGLERATDLQGGFQAWEQPQQKAELAAHWDSAYAQGGHAARSWFQDQPRASLQMLDGAGDYATRQSHRHRRRSLDARRCVARLRLEGPDRPPGRLSGRPGSGAGSIESGCRMGATAGCEPPHLAARMSVPGFGMTAPFCTFSPALVSVSYRRPESPPHSAGGSDTA